MVASSTWQSKELPYSNFIVRLICSTWILKTFVEFAAEARLRKVFKYAGDLPDNPLQERL